MRNGQAELAAFCVVANVAEETAHGEGGLELRRGVRHFPPGAKVWVLPPQWGDGGDQLIVAGRHRGTHGRGLARMVMGRRHLTGFRVEGVYSPAVIRALTMPLTELGRDRPPLLWDTRHHADECAARWQALPLRAHADDWSFISWSPTRRLTSRAPALSGHGQAVNAPSLTESPVPATSRIEGGAGCPCACPARW